MSNDHLPSEKIARKVPRRSGFVDCNQTQIKISCPWPVPRWLSFFPLIAFCWTLCESRRLKRWTPSLRSCKLAHTACELIWCNGSFRHKSWCPRHAPKEHRHGRWAHQRRPRNRHLLPARLWYSLRVIRQSAGGCFTNSHHENRISLPSVGRRHRNIYLSVPPQIVLGSDRP